MALRMAIFALLAVGLLGFGAVAWISSWPSNPAPVVAAQAPPPPPARRTLLVTAHPLRAGGLIRADDLRGQAFDVAEIPAGTLADTPAARLQLSGGVVRHNLGEGQALSSDDVLRPGDRGFLATVLEPGMRAMTLGAGDVTSDWSLIWPGDSVDVVLSQQIDDLRGGHRIAVRTIIEFARVVAIDKQVVQGTTTGADSDPKAGRTLTLELRPSDFEHLVAAQRLGRITLALCAAKPASASAPAPAAVFSEAPAVKGVSEIRRQATNVTAGPSAVALTWDRN